jgi:hypothetical protein
MESDESSRYSLVPVLAMLLMVTFLFNEVRKQFQSQEVHHQPRGTCPVGNKKHNEARTSGMQYVRHQLMCLRAN